MKTVEEYRRHAEECEALANGSTTAEEREMIKEMARTWRMMADRRERMLAMGESGKAAPRRRAKTTKEQ